MKNIGTILAIVTGLVSMSSYALDIHKEYGNRFEFSPASFSDDGNLGRMCDSRANAGRNSAAAYAQRNNISTPYVDYKIDTISTPGQINRQYQAQCDATCDSSEIACTGNAGSTASGCYRDANNQVVCPISQLTTGVCSQLGNCLQNQQSCYSSCAQQAQMPGSESHQCEISVAVQSNHFTLVDVKMNGHDMECSHQLKQDQANGNSIVGDEHHQPGRDCEAEEILIMSDNGSQSPGQGQSGHGPGH